MNSPLRREAPHCLYLDTAAPAGDFPPLTGEHRTEVCVVGGGYTGLSAALHLAERGIAVTLLEAHEPGWGAAGRNGGQVNAGLKHEPDDVEEHFGPVFGPRFVALADKAPERLFALIGRLGIECGARREGTIRAARREEHRALLVASAEQWRRRGVTLDLWDGVRAAAATGARHYVAALFDPRGGSVQPLSLARGMAAAAARAGAAVHGGSPAISLSRQGPGWRVATPSGAVLAGKVVLATDGYSGDLWPGLRTSFVPIYSAIIASEPLPSAMAEKILPSGGVVYEMGDVTVYYRRDAEGRLLVGGRGPQRRSVESQDFRHLRDHALRLWPVLAGIGWTHWWNGQFAHTPDFYPRLHAPAANLFIGLGYSGRGVAMGTAFGAELASAASGMPLDELSVPMTVIPHIPFHALWPVGVTLRVAYARWRERSVVNPSSR